MSVSIYSDNYWCNSGEIPLSNVFSKSYAKPNLSFYSLSGKSLKYYPILVAISEKLLIVPRVSYTLVTKFVFFNTSGN